MMEFVFLKESFEDGSLKSVFDKEPVERGLEQLEHKALLELGEIKWGNNFLGLRTV